MNLSQRLLTDCRRVVWTDAYDTVGRVVELIWPNEIQWIDRELFTTNTNCQIDQSIAWNKPCIRVNFDVSELR